MYVAMIPTETLHRLLTHLVAKCTLKPQNFIVMTILNVLYEALSCLTSPVPSADAFS
jgi:hypothetical protein